MSSGIFLPVSFSNNRFDISFDCQLINSIAVHPITSRTICELVMKLRDLEGVASIFVTHDLESALTVASEFAETLPNGEVVFQSEDNNLCLVNTRFLMLKEGNIIFEGSDEALRSSDDSYIQDFLS